MPSDFDDLVEITAILEERAVALYRESVLQDAELRRELQEIETLRLRALQDDASAHARRISGVDANWQSWLVQRRTALNQKLLMLQVKKAERQDKARQANAKLQVTSELADAERQERRRSLLDQEQDKLQALSLLGYRSET